jgi:hypothetical protein
MPVIPDTQEKEIGRIAVQGQPSQKVSKTPISIKPGVMAYFFDPSYSGGCK